MKYLGGIFFLFLLWVMIFLALAAGGETAVEEKIIIETEEINRIYSSYFADEPEISPETDNDGLIYSYTPEYDGEEVLIRVADPSGQVSEVKLEEYLEGTVFAEMPAKFEPEALKAQAVAARSYCYYKMAHSDSAPDSVHPEADVCNDYTHCKAYMNYETACQTYGEPYAEEAFDKIRGAISSTKDEILVYDGEPALAVFHSMSESFTESAENVWGGDVPYLVSAPTPENNDTENICSEIVFSGADIINRLSQNGYACNPDNPDPVISLNDSGRVGYVIIFGVSVPGVEFRRIFSLRSADFSIFFDADSNQYIISVYGIGHGVGMSQHGANLLALNGFSYRDILFRYYSGVSIFKIG